MVSIGILVSLGTIGLLLVLSGILILRSEKRKRKNCTAVTEGNVIKYIFISNVPSPIVEYQVGGVRYQKRRKYRAVVSFERTRQGMLRDFDTLNNHIYIDENDVAHIRRGVTINQREIAEQMYPMNSKLKVLYNPQNPKQAYVEKIPPKIPPTGWAFLWTGTGIAVLGIFLSMIFRIVFS